MSKKGKRKVINNLVAKYLPSSGEGAHIDKKKRAKLRLLDEQKGERHE